MVARWIIFRKNGMTFHIHVPNHAQSNPSLISNDSGLSLVVTDTFESQITF